VGILVHSVVLGQYLHVRAILFHETNWNKKYFPRNWKSVVGIVVWISDESWFCSWQAPTQPPIQLFWVIVSPSGAVCVA
jgi:hypothetical protein